MNKCKRKYQKIICVFSLGFFLLIISSIPIKIAIARYQQPTPQIIFVLGGGPYREEFAARFALAHPSLPIWISSGLTEARSRQVFGNAGVVRERLNIDRRATDTVTNFTTLVENFQRQDIKHLYLVTSDFHMPRAKAIAYIVLGSYGITFTPIEEATEQLPEAKLKIWRDTGRAILWLFTRRTGSSLNERQK